MTANGLPAPAQTLQVVAAGTYGPADKSWPQRSVPTAVRAWRLSADITSRPVGVSVYVYLEMSWDNGVTWQRDEARIEATDQNAGADISIARGLGGLSTGGGILVEQAGVTRLARGGAVIEGGALVTTGLKLELWT